MRLSKRECRVLIDTFQEQLVELGLVGEAKLFLFGSRVDDSKRGGDIDLLILAPVERVNELRERRVQLINRFHEKLDEQRIDVTVTSPDCIKSDEFFASIADHMIELRDLTEAPFSMNQK